MVEQIKESLSSSPVYQFIVEYTTKIKEFLQSVFKRPLRENLENAFRWLETTAKRLLDFFLTES